MSNEETTTNMDELLQVYREAPQLDKWASRNVPEDDMCWKMAALRQVEMFTAFTKIARDLEELPRVVQTHRSKSIELPVILWKLDDRGFIIVRDNFHDLKIVVVSAQPVELPYDLVHQRVTQKEYDTEKMRSLRYCVKTEGVGPEYDGDDWIKEWSHSRILRKDGLIYKASDISPCYCEGIDRLPLGSEVFHPYETGRSEFGVECGLSGHAAHLLEEIARRMPRPPQVLE